MLMTLSDMRVIMLMTLSDIVYNCLKTVLTILEWGAPLSSLHEEVLYKTLNE